jgi:hypothetical protein
MKTIQLFFAFFLFSLSNGYAQNNPLFSFIPEKSSTVIHIDLLRLKPKMQGGSLANNPINQILSKNPNSAIKDILANPESTGIDFSAGMVIAIEGESGDVFNKMDKGTTIFLKLKDGSKFTSFFKDVKSRNVPDVQTEDDVQVYGSDHLLISDYKMSLAWNNDVVLFTNLTSNHTIWSVEDDTVELSEAQTAKRTELARREQRKVLFDLLASHHTDKIISDTHFAELMKAEGDIKVWDNKSGKFPVMPGQLSGIFARLPSFASQSTSVFNFENGKIVMQSKTYPAAFVKELYKDFKISAQNSELLKKLPPDNLLGSMSITLDPNMIQKIIALPAFQKFLTQMKDKAPADLDVNLLSQALKPTMLLAVMTNNKKAVSEKTRKNDVGVLLAIPIADKGKFEQLRSKMLPLIDSMKKKKEVTLEDGESVPGDAGDLFNPILKFNEEMVVVSLSKEAAENFLYNPAPGEAPAWLHEFSQYPIVMNLNFKKMFFLLLMKRSSEEKEPGMDQLLNTFENLYLYGGNFNKDAVEMNMEFRFVNKEENSLKQLFSLLSQIK